MKFYAINASPRKNWNTATILSKVLEGVTMHDENSYTEMINLYDYCYKGCISCFQCKKINGPSYGKCAIKDEVSPILEKILMGDCIIIGSPIYFSDITGMLKSFLERLLFPCFVYDKNYSSIAPKKIRTAIIYTMNITYEDMLLYHYPKKLGTMETFIGKVFGYKPLIQYVNDTYQFHDYSKYKMEVFSETEKAKQREIQFPVDCDNARKLGLELFNNILEGGDKQ